MLQEPSRPTLKKYGLTYEDWRYIAYRQGYRCGVCGEERERLVIDHEHVRGWKAMPPEERRKYVRGLTCWYCNHAYLGRGITIEKARGVLNYLLAYADRRLRENSSEQQ